MNYHLHQKGWSLGVGACHCEGVARITKENDYFIGFILIPRSGSFGGSDEGFEESEQQLVGGRRAGTPTNYENSYLNLV